MAGAPTVLIYGHYDVQPPDPLELWNTPPFEPTVRDGKVFARGATDDKGQMITHLFGVETWLATKGDLPLQIKFLIEGEEESGSTGMNEFLAGKYDKDIPVTEKIAADIAVISDCSQYAPGQTGNNVGLRGISYFQVELAGPQSGFALGIVRGGGDQPSQCIGQDVGRLH